MQESARNLSKNSLKHFIELLPCTMKRNVCQWYEMEPIILVEVRNIEKEPSSNNFKPITKENHAKQEKKNAIFKLSLIPLGEKDIPQWSASKTGIYSC